MTAPGHAIVHFDERDGRLRTLTKHELPMAFSLGGGNSITILFTKQGRSHSLKQ